MNCNSNSHPKENENIQKNLIAKMMLLYIHTCGYKSRFKQSGKTQAYSNSKANVISRTQHSINILSFNVVDIIFKYKYISSY